MPFSTNLLTFFLSAVILCVPVVCMGATLPILCCNEMDRFPNRAASLAYLAGLYAMQGQSAKAIARYKEAVSADPLSPTLHTRLGFALARQGLPEEAVGHFNLDPVTGLSPNGPQTAHFVI